MNMEDIENKYVPQNFNQQFEEEKIKFDLMQKAGWANAIMEYEDNECLEGRILFLLNYCSNGDGCDLDQFKKCAENAINLLTAKEHQFERLLLNNKDSSYPCQLEDMLLSGQKKKEFGISSVEQFSFFNKGKDSRDFGWHRLLNDNPKDYQSKKRSESLMKCQTTCESLMKAKEDTLKEPITLSEGLDEWKRLLVARPSLIAYCTGSIIYRITYDDETKQYYLSTGSKNGLFNKKNKISELYLRYVYEILHDEDKNWQFNGWSFKDSQEESRIIDCSITNPSKNITVTRIKKEWIVEGSDAVINRNASINDVIKALKEAGN